MKNEDSHMDFVTEISELFKPVLDGSPDGVYLWLDETHMVCNDKLAKMFGYANAKELCSKTPFLDNFVAEDDREMFSSNYEKSVDNFAYPISFRFTALRKGGSKFSAETDMIPVSWKGHAVAYHFVREIK